METNAFTQQEQEVIQSIVENAQYDIKTRISASLRYSGGSEIERTERTPQAYEMFSLVYSDIVKESLAHDLSDQRVKEIVDKAFESIIEESSNDFLTYRKKTSNAVHILYGLAFIILLIAYVLQMLGWTVK